MEHTLTMTKGPRVNRDVSNCTMTLQSLNIEHYLRTTYAIDWDHPSVYKRARDIARGSGDDIEIVRRLFEWVRDHIPHSSDIGSNVLTCKASEVLEEGTGICHAKSHLLAALCRAAGIPAGFCYHVFVRPAPYSGTGIHGFNALYLASIGKWVRVDARGNTGGIEAQFDIQHERLAFPIDPAKGDLFMYEMVFADPAPQVVDMLTRYDDRETMWWHLPAMIDDDLLCKNDQALNRGLGGAEDAPSAGQGR